MIRLSSMATLVALLFTPCATSAQESRLALIAHEGSDSLGIVDIDGLSELAVVETGFDDPQRVIATPDGRRAFVLHSTFEEAQVVPVDLPTFVVEEALSFPGPVVDMTVSPDGRWLLLAGLSPTRLVRVDLDEPQSEPSVLTLLTSDQGAKLSVSRDGRSVFLVSGSQTDGLLFQIDVETMTLEEIEEVPWPVSDVERIADPDLLAEDLLLIAWGGPSLSLFSTASAEITTLPIPVEEFSAGPVEFDAARQRVIVTDITSFPPPDSTFSSRLDGTEATTLAPAQFGGLGVRVSNGRYYGVRSNGGVAVLDPDSPATFTVLPSAEPSSPFEALTGTVEDRFVYVSFIAPSSWMLTVIDTETDQVLGNVPLSGVLPGALAIVECPSAPGIDRCLGSGAEPAGCTACPCLNDALAGAISGCLNSSGLGARLLGSGNPSVSSPAGAEDDLRFALQGAPPFVSSILVSGEALAPTSASNPCFGLGTGVTSALLDGLRCAVGNVRRHGVRSVDAAGTVGIQSSPWGGEGPPDDGIVTSSAGFHAGQTRFFQAVMRESVGAVCGTGLTTSQAIEITLCP